MWTELLYNIAFSLTVLMGQCDLRLTVRLSVNLRHESGLQEVFPTLLKREHLDIDVFPFFSLPTYVRHTCKIVPVPSRVFLTLFYTEKKLSLVIL